MNIEQQEARQKLAKSVQEKSLSDLTKAQREEIKAQWSEQKQEKAK